MNTAHNLFVSDNTPELSPEETDFYSALFSFVYHAGGNARGLKNLCVTVILLKFLIFKKLIRMIAKFLIFWSILLQIADLMNH